MQPKLPSRLFTFLVFACLLLAGSPKVASASGDTVGQEYRQHLPIVLKHVPSTGSIAGAVQSTAHSGVSDVTVEVSGKNGFRQTTRTSGRDGLYSFQVLPTGRYTVRPSRTGYEFEPLSRVVDVPSFDAQFVSFTARKLPAQTGSISGRAADRQGRGIQNVMITAERGLSLYNAMTTGIDGIFTLDDLPAGRYRVYPMDLEHEFEPAWIDVDVPSFEALFLEFTAKP